MNFNMSDLTNMFTQNDALVETTFILDGKNYEIEQFQIKFSQEIDHRGQPQHEVHGGFIYLTLAQSVDDNIYDWAKRTNKPKNGKIIFQNQVEGTILEVLFEKGHCIRLERVVNALSGVTTNLLISPGKVTLNGITHDNKWKED